MRQKLATAMGHSGGSERATGRRGKRWTILGSRDAAVATLCPQDLKRNRMRPMGALSRSMTAKGKDSGKLKIIGTGPLRLEFSICDAKQVGGGVLLT
jgi:hypothetical protein